MGGVGGGVEMAKFAISVTGVDGGMDETDMDRWMPRRKLKSKSFHVTRQRNYLNESMWARGLQSHCV